MNDPALAKAPSPSELPDAAVVARVLAGEVALFELLVRRNNARVYRAIRGILRDEAEVEDAMQQVYLDAYRRLAQFAGDSAFSTWLTRIAINEALGRVRRHARLTAVAPGDEALEDPLSPPPETPEDRAASREAAALLERAVDRLPLHLRSAFVLREVEGLSTAEAAAALGIEEQALKMRLHRARLALKDALLETAGEAASSAFPFFAPRCNRVTGAVMAAIARGEGG